MTYQPQPGYPHQSGYPPRPGYPPGYGYPPPVPPSNALAYVLAGLFLCCSALSFVLASIGWDGSADSPEPLAALVGVVFTEDITGNIDFAISATMTVACSVLTFAIVQLFRLDPIRWVLAVLGLIVTGYYLYALIYLLANDGAEVVVLVIVALLLWLAATAVALLPATGRAMRGHQRRHAGFGPPPPAGYPGGY